MENKEKVYGTDMDKGWMGSESENVENNSDFLVFFSRGPAPPGPAHSAIRFLGMPVPLSIKQKNL